MTVQLLQKVGWTGLIAFLFSALAAPVIFRLLLRAGSRQTVSEHVPEHAGKQGTPTMGGLIVMVGVVAAFVACGDQRNLFTGFLFLWYAVIGFLDDFLVPRMMPGKRGLGWMPKIGLQVVPFLVLWLLSPGTPLWILATSAIVVLFMANAYNFSDGLDGLAGGLGVMLALTLSIAPLLVLALNPAAAVDVSLSPVLFGLAVAFVPFLVLNSPPAKVFMGDVGSLPIGALLGMGLLQGTVFRDPFVPSFERVVPYLPFLLVMLVEIVPVPLQIASAKLRKGKRLFPFRTPVHHAFQAAGWPETRVVAIFMITQFMMGLVTLAMVAGLFNTATVRWDGGP